MYKISLLTAIMIILFFNVQCTEDETIETAIYDSEVYGVESGEEGADDKDSDKD